MIRTQVNLLLWAAQKQEEAIPSDCGRKLTDQPGFLEDPIQATFGKTRVGVRVNTSLKLLNTKDIFKVTVDFVGAHTERRTLHFGLIIRNGAK